ncbi:MAG: hypothetical protein K8S21_11380 [Gemmatimonadetes bacterium]|nr:hypothetical protein [Gemmatimonadota bacterium]
MRSFRHSVVRLALLVVLLPAALRAQHAGGGAASSTSTAPKEAEQFAFLVGQWEVTVMPKVSSLVATLHGQPKLLGTWKAWRAFDGFGVEDELRIIDGSGNPNALSHSMRIYDVTLGKWTQTSLDVYRGRFTTANGTWAQNALSLRSVGRDAEGKPFVQRSRFYDITATGFKYEVDRSNDGERTWETGVVRIEAKRVAASAAR